MMKAPWFLAVDHWLNRKAIREAEAELAPSELETFRLLLKTGPWRDAYAVATQGRRLVPKRQDSEVVAFDAR